ncbi:hypothetical protein BKA62DRAFT_771619 [Auriculariales sp. MPI-PUGE-AT-0066]|nr:hypothetical protein BKA62DRAFT_771619 [Auriculariales sp. MPI-PUGE-AT-0066]
MATTSSSSSVAGVKLSEVHVFDKMQWMMERAHNVFKLGHESILKHLEEPDKLQQDLPNFLGYCGCWAGDILVHHDTEEMVLFPFFSPRLDMSGEVDQHKVMHDHLDGILAYVNDPTTPLTFDADTLRQKMTAIRDPLFHHLDSELEHIRRENMERNFSPQEIEDILHKLDTYAQAHANPWTELPFFISHVAPPYRGNFPELPWIVSNVMLPIFALRHSGRWKYSPYSAFNAAG